MSLYRYLSQQDLPAFLSFLRGQFERVYVPKAQEGTKPSVVFDEWHENDPFTLTKATVAPKEVVFPKCEELFHFLSQKQEDGRGALTLTENLKAPKTVLFATRACDAQGLTILDRPFLQGRFVDPYYKAKREALCVITLTCASGCETCFCHWVGCGPSSPNGADILMTEIAGGGYVLQSVTQKGEELLRASELTDAQDKVESMNQARKEAFASLQKAPDLSSAPKALLESFDDMAFWEAQTAHCLGCGACTYFCPTCYCFTITDEGEAQSKQGGRRLRSHDTCMQALYTRETSGHNPRPTKAHRMRNRVSHKYMTYPEAWGGLFSCSGCGRCVANCPVGLDIRAIVLAALKRAQKGGN